MAIFEVKIRGLAKLEKAFYQYPKIAEPIFQKTINATHAIFAKHTLKENPIPWRSGNLLHSFRFKSARLRAKWFPTAYYAPFVELGTRPHIIRPKRAKVLRWNTGGGGKYVTAKSGKQYYKSGNSQYRFARFVRHPGTRPQPFMKKIVKRSDRDINILFGRAGDKINQAIAKRINKL